MAPKLCGQCARPSSDGCLRRGLCKACDMRRLRASGRLKPDTRRRTTAPPRRRFAEAYVDLHDLGLSDEAIARHLGIQIESLRAGKRRNAAAIAALRCREEAHAL